MRPSGLRVAVQGSLVQPCSTASSSNCPGPTIPTADLTRDQGHGRSEIRRLQVATVAGLAFPHATQALRITRRVRGLRGRRWRRVTVYAITSLTHFQASPARLADWVRGHWGIETLHHIRDTTFAEDASQVRTGNAPKGHGDLTQPGRGDPALMRPCQHRRRATPLRPRRHPCVEAPWRHKLMNQTFPHFDGALPLLEAPALIVG
jgi:Transposase DDE domain